MSSNRKQSYDDFVESGARELAETELSNLFDDLGLVFEALPDSTQEQLIDAEVTEILDDEQRRKTAIRYANDAAREDSERTREDY